MGIRRSRMKWVTVRRRRRRRSGVRQFECKGIRQKVIYDCACKVHIRALSSSSSSLPYLEASWFLAALHYCLMMPIPFYCLWYEFELIIYSSSFDFPWKSYHRKLCLSIYTSKWHVNFRFILICMEHRKKISFVSHISKTDTFFAIDTVI